jgi:hypothetical protein
VEHSADYLMTFARGIQKFFGAFFYADAPIWFGFVVCAAIGALIWRQRARFDLYFWLLALCLVLIGAMTTLRLWDDLLANLDKFGEGTRYFFYPFVLLSWLLIWLAAESERPIRRAIAGAVGVAVLLALPHMSLRNDHLDWRRQLAACAASSEYELPIHYQGKNDEVWKPKFTGAQCQAMIDRSLFR